MPDQRYRILAAVGKWLEEQGNGSIRTLMIQHVPQKGKEVPEHIQLIHSDVTKVDFLVMDDGDSPF